MDCRLLGAPRVAAGVVDPNLLVDWQTQAADRFGSTTPAATRGAPGRSTAKATKAARPPACSTHAGTWPAAGPVEVPAPPSNRLVHARLQVPHLRRLQQLRRQLRRQPPQLPQLRRPQRLQLLPRRCTSRCVRGVTKCTAWKPSTSSGMDRLRALSISIETAT